MDEFASDVATPARAAVRPASPRLLVVDLCGTIVRENTTHAFLREAALGGWRGSAARALLSRAGFAAALMMPRGGHRALACACLAGVEREGLRAAAARYAERALARSARRSVLDEIDASRSAGVPVVLASASLDVIVEAFARRLGATDWIATELGWGRDGRCSGRIVRDATGRKLSLLVERRGPLPPMRVLTDNPEDTDLVDAAIEARIVRAHDD